MTAECDTGSPDVRRLALEFAESLASTLEGVIANVPPIAVELLGHRFVVQPSNPEAEPVSGKTGTIPLTVGDEHVLNLRVSMHCSLDSHNRYLTVDKSVIALELPGTRAQPLFRFDYDRTPSPGVPAAHVQVHAHRDEIVYLASRPSRRRAKGRAAKGDVTRLSELHIPVGGHRFRPCVEDVLEFAAEEFGIDTVETWRTAIRAGRESWREKQVATVVRDCPHRAAEALVELGYEVLPPDSGAPDGRPDRMTAY